jgi:hypothetical protein
MYGLSRDAHPQAAVNISCWHKTFVLYMMWWKSHGRTSAIQPILWEENAVGVSKNIPLTTEGTFLEFFSFFTEWSPA